MDVTVRRVIPYSDAGTQVDATNIKERIHVHTYQCVSFISSISFVSMCICVHDYMQILMDICVHTCVDICKCTCFQENDERNLIPVYAHTKVSCSCKHMHVYLCHAQRTCVWRKSFDSSRLAFSASFGAYDVPFRTLPRACVTDMFRGECNAECDVVCFDAAESRHMRDSYD